LESRAVCEQINKQTANETIMVVEQTTGWYVASPMSRIIYLFRDFTFSAAFFDFVFDCSSESRRAKEKEVTRRVQWNGMGNCVTWGCGSTTISLSYSIIE
jgi:hypothetical protein